MRLLLLIALAGCANQPAPPPPSTPVAESAPVKAEEPHQAIRATFHRYRDAIAAKNGEAAVNEVSERTLSAFEAYRTAALSMPADQVKARPIVERLMIVIVRARVPAPELRQVNGRELFVRAVDNGWVGKNVATIDAAEVSLDGDSAHLGVRTSRGELPPAQGFTFHREKGSWKMDVMSLAAFDASLKAMLSRIDEDENRAMLKVVSLVAKTHIDDRIWEPLDSSMR
jgi:hypothetical protein